MPEFKYTAIDPKGQKISSKIDAPDESSAAKALMGQGYRVTKINPAQGKGLIGRWQSRIPAKEKVVFVRQLATLVNASLPLLQSLRLVANQTTNKNLQNIINEIADALEGGVPFSTALGRYPDVFNQVFVGVVSAGEASGTLDTSLDRLAMQQERDSGIISKVRGAMIYPAIILVVMIAVVGFMVVKVLPQVQTLYSSVASGATMPLITRLLLGVSRGVTNYWWIVIIALGFIVFFLRRWMKTEKGKSSIDGYKMHWPLIGRLFMKLYMARFARITSTLLASGLPLLQVLQITSGAIDNVHVGDSINAASEKVRGGKSLSEALDGDKNFLPLVPNMLKIGEQSGALETMMSKTADYFEKEVDDEVETLSTTLEPVLMVLMGVVALIIVAAVLLPIYGLVGKNVNLG